MTARVVAGRTWYPTSRAVIVAALGGAALAVLTALVLWPLAAVVVTGIREVPRAGTAVPLPTLARTLELAAVSTVLTVVLATVVVYAALRCAAPGGALAHRVLTLGLVLPPFLPAFGLSVLTGGRAGFAIVVSAQVLAFLPYAYLAVGHALADVHSDQEDVAESLGAGRFRILTRITLVALRPGLATAVSAVALLGLADFVNPFLVGGDYTVLTTLIYARVPRGADLGLAAALALWLLAPCLVVAALGRFRAGVIVAMPVARRRLHRPTPPPVAVPLAIVAAGVTLVLLAVYTAVVAAALVTVSERGVAWLGGAGPLLGSVTIAAATAVASTVLALVVAGVVTRGAPGAALLEYASLLPASVPGLVLGLGLLLAYAPVDPEILAALFVAGLVGVRMPVAVAAGVAAVRRLDANLMGVAASLGASRRRAFSRVLAPLLTPVAASILVAVFVRTLGAVSVVALLTGPYPALASLAALDAAVAGDRGEACALAVALSVVILVVVGLRRALPGREHAAVWFL